MPLFSPRLTDVDWTQKLPAETPLQSKLKQGYRCSLIPEMLQPLRLSVQIDAALWRPGELPASQNTGEYSGLLVANRPLLTAVHEAKNSWIEIDLFYCSGQIQANILACCVYLLTYLILTYLLTPRSRVLLEKLTGFHLVQKVPAFYGTRRFITAFTNPRDLSLSRASSIQSITTYPTFWRYILILNSHLGLGLPSGLFPSGFPTKTLHTPLLSQGMEERPPIWRIAVNILNKQSPTADKGWSSSLGFGRGAKNSSP